MPRALKTFMAGLAAAAALAGAAHAGGRLPCREAAVFPGAAVNAIVMPYRSEGRLDPMRLSALIQQELLFSMLKYRSVGATELTGDPEQCDVHKVIEQVNRNDDRSLRPGRGLVIVWGRVYEEHGDVYVQSYVRFLRARAGEGLRVELRDGDARLELSGGLRARAAALAPRKVSQRDFAEIERRAAQALVTRERPEENAPQRVTPMHGAEPLSYSVVETSGEWMRIRSLVDPRQGGWVRARMNAPEWSLRRFLPEMAYLDGIVGYLRLMVDDGGQMDRQRVFAWMQAAFKEYEEAVGRDAAPEAQALARSLTALALWNDPQKRAEAAKLLREALDYAPSSADTRVLAAITAPVISGQAASKETLWQLNRSLLGALAVDPKNPPALANLERLYAFAAQSPAVSPYPLEELQSRRASIKAVREARPR